MKNTHCSKPKGIYLAKVTSKSEKINPVALAIIELHLCEASVTLENSVIGLSDSIDSAIYCDSESWLRYIMIVSHDGDSNSSDINVVIVTISSDLLKNSINKPSTLFYS